MIGAPSGLGKADFPALAQIYPYDADGAVFDSSDDALNQVWELSRHTIEATNHNLYVDSWSRERGAYEADSYLQMMANFFVSSDPTLGNYSLDYLLTQRTWPTEWPIYTILAFHDSYLQTGDTAGIARNYDALVEKLPDEWIEASTGLVRKNAGSNGSSGCGLDCDIVDWPTSERDGYVFRPYNTVINAISHQAYRDMAEIAKTLGKDADAQRFTATADRLREVANARLFDEEKGAYRDGLNADGTPIDHYAFHASVFATAFGLANEGRAERTADYIESRGMACSVYCAAFVLESLYEGDRAGAAHAVLTSTGLRSWMNMIAKGAGATAEAWDVSLKSNMTWSHPWAASPAYNVPQGMFGIEPTTPGYATFDVRPQPEAVDWAHVTLPTLKGGIGAAHHTVDGRADVGVHVPGNTVARVFVPGAEEGDDTVYVDGRATPASYERGYLRVDDVAAGCHVLSLEPGAAAMLDERLTAVCPDGYRGALLDDFDRPDGGVGDGWLGPKAPRFYAVTDQALDVRLGGSLVREELFGTTQEASVRLVEVDPEGSQGLLLKAQGGSVPGAAAISVVYDGPAEGVRVSVLRSPSVGWTDYGVTKVAYADGDVLRARVDPDGVTVWRSGEKVASVALEGADRSFFEGRGGRVGLWTDGAADAVLDDLRGGTIG
ncbi:alpha-L-rhamnosidase C-terminal domain-containing protein [Mumia sp. DW29H23]|uniref:alpha-L-rhamnosidase-related protein n=1 Tax=Mumia sp. DW29H23 TaxID=3421241 RepID=UPI003D69F97E